MNKQNTDLSVIKNIKNNSAAIILNRPEKGNVVNNENLLLIHEYLKEAIESKDCRIIIIQGKDQVFSKGMDFQNLLRNSKYEITKEFSEPYKQVIKLIYKSPKPVIAAIDGYVLAGGMGLALACDIIIATKRSSFGLSEVLFGIIPAYVFPLLLERISFKKARSIILTSKLFTAHEAYQFGIVDEIVENDKLEKNLKRCIKRLLFSSPEALALTKHYSDKLKENNIDRYIEYAQEELTKLLNKKNVINAIKSFLEGKKPGWAITYKNRI